MTPTMLARLGLLCATAAFVMPGTAAQAQEGVAIKNMLGNMGLIPKEKDAIQYRERAPLVLPPKMELREPASSESFASNNPQWPNDPDVAAKRKRSADQSIPVTSSEIRRMSERNPNLTIDEIRQGRTISAEKTEVGRRMSDKEGVWISPDELRRGQKTDDAKTVADNAPVQRRTLADPPSVYRKSARGGTVASTYEPRVDQQQADSNPMNFLTRMFNKSDDD